MIFYFSGTGNSRLAAQQIATTTQDKMVSINEILKGSATAPFDSNMLTPEEPLVFVSPVYAWRLPRIFSDWIERTDFASSKKAYFVLTCGESIGNAADFARNLCQKKGFEFCGMAKIVMPENYIAMYPAPSKVEAAEILQRADLEITQIAEKIATGAILPAVPCDFMGKVQSSLINSIFYTFIVKDKGFFTTTACTSCGRCEMLCPLNNISLRDGKPLWHGNCTHCMACICGCPTEAIEYKNKTRGQFRYHADKIR